MAPHPGRPPSPPSPRQPVVYTVQGPTGGSVDLKGERGQYLLYIALGIAAQRAYLTLQPVLVLEDGLPHRWVALHSPSGGPLPPRP